MLQALAETVKSATWRMTMPNATYSTIDAVPTILTILHCWEMWDGTGGHWLVCMEWCPAGWSVCLPLLIFPCTMKSRSSLLALAHPGGPGKSAVKQLWRV